MRQIFDGETIEPCDTPRLMTQLQAVFAVMSDGEYRTIGDLTAMVRERTGSLDTEAAVSARLRDFRKLKFGGHDVNRRRVHEQRGLHEYQLIPAACKKRQASLF